MLINYPNRLQAHSLCPKFVSQGHWRSQIQGDGSQILQPTALYSFSHYSRSDPYHLNYFHSTKTAFLFCHSQTLLINSWKKQFVAETQSKKRSVNCNEIKTKYGLLTRSIFVQEVLYGYVMYSLECG